MSDPTSIPTASVTLLIRLGRAICSVHGFVQDANRDTASRHKQQLATGPDSSIITSMVCPKSRYFKFPLLFYSGTCFHNCLVKLVTPHKHIGTVIACFVTQFLLLSPTCRGYHQPCVTFYWSVTFPPVESSMKMPP